MAAANDPTWVYQAMCEHGALLYVGVAYDVQKRIAQHRKTKSWWHEVDLVLATQYDTRAEALQLEARMITVARPNYNIVGRPKTKPVEDYVGLWATHDARGRWTGGN